MRLKINIIGAGKVGQTLGYLFVKHQSACIQSVFNTKHQHAIDAIQWMGEGTYHANIQTMPHADITFITTPDDFIEKTCFILSQNSHLKPGDIIVHCSGVLSSDALISVKARGCFVASVHPMRSFANLSLSAAQYAGTYCAMEGDIEALQVIEPLFKSIGSMTYLVQKSKKELYHAGAVFAANYLVTLAQIAIDCFEHAGIESETAKQVTMTLMQSVCENLQKTSPEQALTGPIQRGDLVTIQKHMNYLSEPHRVLYRNLGYQTLLLTTHEGETLKKLHMLFKDPGDKP